MKRRKNISRSLGDKADIIRGRAMRLRSARALTGMSRREFSEAFQIPEPTLTAWENQTNPLSMKGAKRVCEAFSKRGLYCTVSWLMEGIGVSPRTEDDIQANYKPITTQEEEPLEEENHVTAEALTLKEISTFRHIHKNAVVKLVLDDAMHPFYEAGDYVGGVWTDEPDNFVKLLHKNCIIETQNGDIVIRKLLARKNTETFTLAGINPLTCIDTPILYDQVVVRVAEIIWYRRQPSIPVS